MKGLVVFIVLLHIWAGVAAQSRIWTIALGFDWGSHEYLNNEGYLQGQGPDLIDKVCGEAGMDCRIVIADYSKCWQTNPIDNTQSGGDGLLSRWFDACSSWFGTIARQHTFTFTKAHFQHYLGYFYVRKGERFDVGNLARKKIGFVNGWVLSDKCVIREDPDAGFDSENARFYVNPTEMLKALQARQIDIGFTSSDTWTPSQLDQMDEYGTGYNCAGVEGYSMMSRKDTAFAATWNVGLNKLRNTKKWTKFCDESNAKHDHKGPPFLCYDA